MRLTTIGVNFFQHDGLAVGSGWSEFDYATADSGARASFREHVGRFIKIHADDLDELGDFALTLEGGRIVDAEPEPSHDDGEDEGKEDGDEGDKEEKAETDSVTEAPAKAAAPRSRGRGRRPQ